MEAWERGTQRSLGTAMSDPVDETPEDFTFPGPNIAKNQVVIPIAGRHYVFEKTENGTLIYVDNFAIAVVDEEEPKPFDPSGYR